MKPLAISTSHKKLLAPILPELSFPSVPKIDCANCIRVQEGNALPEMKCCDIIPHFPNFLVGEILDTEPLHSQGSKVIFSWLKRGWATPYYLRIPPEVLQEHYEARMGRQFGMSCPLVIPGEGECSVYSTRPGLCVTHYCYFPNALWKEAWGCFHWVLETLQDAACRFLVTQMDLELEGLDRYWGSVEDESELWDGDCQKEKVLAASWQHWRGREVEFYRGCYRWLRDMGPDQLKELFIWQAEQLQKRIVSGVEEPLETSEGQEKTFALPFVAEKPSPSIRKQYRLSRPYAEKITLTLQEQGSHLLWYLDEVQAPGLFERIAQLWR